MNNPNSPLARIKKSLVLRWSSEDYPGGEARFQLVLLGKDIGVFVLLPALAVILVRACDGAGAKSKQIKAPQVKRSDAQAINGQKSQIIDFDRPRLGSPGSGGAKRAIGTLVKVKLLNQVDTYSTAPVHAQIIDNGLGSGLRGGVLIGDAISDTNFDRINITFRYARDPYREIAFPISGRALSLDGSMGLDAKKKQGLVARATVDSASSISANSKDAESDGDLKSIVVRALSAGLIKEFGASSQIERNRSQVLTLTPSTVFFVELTETFSGVSK